MSDFLTLLWKEATSPASIILLCAFVWGMACGRSFRPAPPAPAPRPVPPVDFDRDMKHVHLIIAAKLRTIAGVRLTATAARTHLGSIKEDLVQEIAEDVTREVIAVISPEFVFTVAARYFSGRAGFLEYVADRVYEAVQSEVQDLNRTRFRKRFSVTVGDQQSGRDEGEEGVR